MGSVEQFEDLGVWQEARQVLRTVYQLSNQREFYRDWGLREQIRRTAAATMSNIAEGFERGGKKEFIHFLTIARGSNGEVRSQLYIARDQEYLTETEFNTTQTSVALLSRRLSTFIRYLENYPRETRSRTPAVSRA